MRSRRAWSFALVLAAAAVGSAPLARAQAQEEDAYADTDPNALVDFHATLDPYGNWIDDPAYGTVWTPNVAAVGPDFTPYATGGHWAYGDDYTWVSDYDWGWAPFHYGRWVYIDGRGWAWIAGRQYAPAWVQWRVGEPGTPFVGWAPAPPAYAWRGGVAVELAAPVPPRFVFCSTGDVFHPRLFERIVRGPQVDVVARRTRPFDERPGGGGRRFFGPPPPRLGLDPARIVRVSGYEPGVARARDFGRPAVAVHYGAHPPEHASGPVRPLERPGMRPEERPGEPRARPFEPPPVGRPVGAARSHRAEPPPERSLGGPAERPVDRPVGRAPERSAERPVERGETPHPAGPPQVPARAEQRPPGVSEARAPTAPRPPPQASPPPRHDR